MAGSINGIFFTKDGVIPAHIISNLSAMATEAKQYRFTVNFWTNVAVLSSVVRKQLLKARVVIRDYKELESPSFVMWLIELMWQGHHGDPQAYTVASEILSVALIESIPEDELYIYANCNDIEFLDLSYHLARLQKAFDKNPFGLSFPITSLASGLGVKNMRNDCMIVRKSNNPAFVQQFVNNYTKAIVREASRYVLAEKISYTSNFIKLVKFETFLFGWIKMSSYPELAEAEVINFSHYMGFRKWMGSWETSQAVDCIDELSDFLKKGGTSEKQAMTLITKLNLLLKNVHKLDAGVIDALLEKLPKLIALERHHMDMYSKNQARLFFQEPTASHCAAVPGYPDDEPPHRGSTTCLEGDERAAPTNEIIRDGHVHRFKDLPRPMAASSVSLAGPKKTVFQQGNIHGFKDLPSPLVASSVSLAVPKKAVVQQGNIHGFKDLPSPLVASSVSLSGSKKTVVRGNIHFFRDSEPPSVTVLHVNMPDGP